MYELIWAPAAADAIVQAVEQLDAAGGQRVRAAVTEVDRLLTASPADAGESREPGVRFVYVPPLGITFSIDPDRPAVWVRHVTVSRRPA